MSIFKNPTDEDRLCHVLKAYVEEWGPQNVIVSVPNKSIYGKLINFLLI